jgi:hypothetical protein
LVLVLAGWAWQGAPVPPIANHLPRFVFVWHEGAKQIRAPAALANA